MDRSFECTHNAKLCAQINGRNFIMDTCPVCGADTRQGDNYCLNCGHRLFAATPSSSSIGDPTLAASSDDWHGVGGSSPGGWPIDPAAQTVAASEDAMPASSAAPVAQAILDKTEQ